MNWILFLVIAIFAVFGFIGWKKGIIKIVVSLATLIITLLLAVFIAPAVCQGLKTATKLDEGLQEIVYNVIMQQKLKGDAGTAGEDGKPQDTQENGNISGIVGELPEELKNIEADKGDIDKYLNQIADNAGKASAYAGQIIDKLNLPDNVKEQMKQMVSEQNIRNMIENNEITNIINQTDGSLQSVMVCAAATKLADLIFRAIVYTIVFIVVFAILRVIVVATDIVSRLPVIRQANKAVGLVLGLVEGLIAVWIMFVVITACGSMEWAADALTDISSSKLLSMLYESDIILKMIFK